MFSTSCSFVSPETNSPFTRAKGVTAHCPQLPRHPYSIISRFGSRSSSSIAFCVPLAKLLKQNSMIGRICFTSNPRHNPTSSPFRSQSFSNEKIVFIRKFITLLLFMSIHKIVENSSSNRYTFN